MLETFRNAWKIEDLRKRLLFTLLILVLFRLGCALPVPYISAGALTSMFAGGNGDMLEYLNMMSGGALSECTLFALGVQPAINASIIMQLLAVAIPYLENLAKEGEEGQRKMRRITNYVGAGIGLMLSIGYYFIIRNMGALSYTEGFAGIFSAVVIVLSFTAGSQLHLDGQPDRLQGHRQRSLADDLRRHRGPLVQHLHCYDQHPGPRPER